MDLPGLMDEALLADEKYKKLVEDAAVARADYEEAREQAKLLSKASSVAARNEEADSAAIRERRLWLIAESREKAAATHVRVLLGVMVAAQSQAKHARNLDGGDW